MSQLASTLRSLRKAVGLVRTEITDCPACGLSAPSDVELRSERGTTRDDAGLTVCECCELPLASDDVIVERYARGYLVNARVIDLRGAA